MTTEQKIAFRAGWLSRDVRWTERGTYKQLLEDEEHFDRQAQPAKKKGFVFLPAPPQPQPFFGEHFL
jgi:hypothetical protein